MCCGVGDVCFPAVTTFENGEVCAGWEALLRDASTAANEVASCPPQQAYYAQLPPMNCVDQLAAETCPSLKCVYLHVAGPYYKGRSAPCEARQQSTVFIADG